MAKQPQQNVQGSVSGAEDGFLYIRGFEDNLLQKYLDEYQATIMGYKATPGDMFTNVTMKIEFTNGTSEGNANLWAYFIAKAAHPTCNKPRIKVMMHDIVVYAYVTWPIWNTVKHVESKARGNQYDF